jgi:hypothetical protein
MSRMRAATAAAAAGLVWMLSGPAAATGSVVYKVEVRGSSSVWISVDCTVDDASGTLVGVREGIVVGGSRTGHVRPGHFHMAMGQQKRYPAAYANPSRATLRGRGRVVVDFYCRRRLVHTAVLPFEGGRFLRKTDRYTYSTP